MVDNLTEGALKSLLRRPDVTELLRHHFEDGVPLAESFLQGAKVCHCLSLPHP